MVVGPSSQANKRVGPLVTSVPSSKALIPPQQPKVMVCKPSSRYAFIVEYRPRHPLLLVTLVLLIAGHVPRQTSAPSVILLPFHALISIDTPFVEAGGDVAGKPADVSKLGDSCAPPRPGDMGFEEVSAARECGDKSAAQPDINIARDIGPGNLKPGTVGAPTVGLATPTLAMEMAGLEEINRLQFKAEATVRVS